VNIARLTRNNRMPRYAAPSCHEREGVMRHILFFSLAVAPLSFGVVAGPAEGTLVASAGAAHRFQASKLGALARAVEVSAVAFRADAHLHPAALTMVEPVGRRLLEQPQDPPPRRHWTAPGRRGIKALAKPPPKALGTEGPGVRRQSNDPGLRLICYPTRENS